MATLKTENGFVEFANRIKKRNKVDVFFNSSRPRFKKPLFSLTPCESASGVTNSGPRRRVATRWDAWRQLTAPTPPPRAGGPTKYVQLLKLSEIIKWNWQWLIEIWYSSSTKIVIVGILILKVRVNFEGHFFLCPYKMSYFRFGPIGSKLVWIEVICSQDYKKKLSAEKVDFNYALGRFSYLTFDPKIWKLTLSIAKIDFSTKNFSSHLENKPLRFKPVYSRSDRTGSNRFYRG